MGWNMNLIEGAWEHVNEEELDVYFCKSRTTRFNVIFLKIWEQIEDIRLHSTFGRKVRRPWGYIHVNKFGSRRFI